MKQLLSRDNGIALSADTVLGEENPHLGKICPFVLVLTLLRGS